MWKNANCDRTQIVSIHTSWERKQNSFVKTESVKRIVIGTICQQYDDIFLTGIQLRIYDDNASIITQHWYLNWSTMILEPNRVS